MKSPLAMDPACVVGDWYPAAFDQEVTEIPHMRLELGFEDFFCFLYGRPADFVWHLTEVI